MESHKRNVLFSDDVDDFPHSSMPSIQNTKWTKDCTTQDERNEPSPSTHCPDNLDIFPLQQEYNVDLSS